MTNNNCKNDKKINIKQYVQKLMIVSLVQAVLFCALSAQETFAISAKPIDFEVKQSIVTESAALPQDLAFEYQFVSKTSGAPMPGNSNLEKYTFTIDGIEDFLTDEAYFGSPGIFIYEVSCITAQKEDFIIDRRLFKIEVHVTLDGEIFVVIRKDNGDKVGKIVFEHIYAPKNTGDSGNTGGGGDSGDSNNNDKPKIKEEPSKEEKPDEIKNKEDIIEAPENPDKVSETNTPKLPGVNPKTGVESNQNLWLMLMILSGLFMLLFFFKNRKSNNNAATL